MHVHDTINVTCQGWNHKWWEFFTWEKKRLNQKLNFFDYRNRVNINEVHVQYIFWAIKFFLFKHSEFKYPVTARVFEVYRYTLLNWSQRWLRKRCRWEKYPRHLAHFMIGWNRVSFEDLTKFKKFLILGGMVLIVL